MHFFFKNFHVSLSLDQGKQFSLTQCLALTKKKKKKKKKKRKKKKKTCSFTLGSLKLVKFLHLQVFLAGFSG